MAELNDYRQELKSKILEVAMREFITQGIRKIKMDDIAHMLRISKRTLYEIFADKESLLLEGIQLDSSRFELMMEEYARQPGVNVVDIIVKFFEMQLEKESGINPQFYVDIRKFPRIIKFVDDMKGRLNKNSAGFFTRGVEEGLFRDDIDHELIFTIRSYALSSIMEHQLYKSYSVPEIINNFTLVLTRGICTEKGIALLDGAMRKYH